jgi:type II secretory pathway component PulM
MARLARLNPLRWAATEAALEWWDSRAARERLLLLGTVAVVVAFAAFLASRTMDASLQAAEERRNRAADRLQTVQMLFAEYQQRRTESEARNTRLATFQDFSLAGFLERTARELGLTESLGNLNDRGVQAGDPYSEHLVDVRFRNIALTKVVELLHKIESHEAPIRVMSMTARTNTRERSEITLTLTVGMLKLPDAPVEP